MSDTEDSPRWYKRPMFRIGLLLAVVAGIWTIGLLTGAHEHLTPDKIRSTVGDAGVLGAILFVGLFCAGQVAQVSGHPFIAASVFVWGGWLGGLVALVGATLGALVGFAFARTIGGDVRSVPSPRLQKILATLDKAPIRTVALARVVFMTAPPLSTTLALTGLRHRDHAAGSFLGLLPSIFISVVGWVHGLKWLGI